MEHEALRIIRKYRFMVVYTQNRIILRALFFVLAVYD